MRWQKEKEKTQQMGIIYFLPTFKLLALYCTRWGLQCHLPWHFMLGAVGWAASAWEQKIFGRSGRLGLGGRSKQVAERESLVLGIPSLSIGCPRHIPIGAGSNSACSCWLLDEVIYYFLVLYVCSTTFEKQPPWDGKLPFSLNFFSSSFPHPPTSAHTCAFTLRSFLPP